MTKILVVEDDEAMSQVIGDSLELDRYLVEQVFDGKEALERLRLYDYDLIVLDWGLPGLSGIEVCSSYRSAGGKAAILMLTAKSDIAEKESGFDAGADDYLTKPFNERELRARVKALLRRPTDWLNDDGLRFGNVVLQTSSYRINVCGKEVELYPREFVLLEFLMKHADQVFSVDVLLNRVWPNESDATVNALRSCITRLRKKIEIPGSGCLIRSIYGMGYKLESNATE